ncbi:amidohydrolase [Mesorhizobium sp. VK25A]|uniref:Amidohydrolase n=1 Tax=Mesorhizobium vachelliae TaxID=3072309 RepID=A0ABU4ZZI8_9HYPH|nr:MULTISPECIES: amidohydrolase [unclassified Mesorhizobium]MDX8530822.1 amidohydrolase [Mesorhizobium sp. VK25D]MDX8543427.1 amidohydrolase [Mesorhizobium sp. VK25A]
MVFRLGEKYQNYVCSNGCVCGNPQEWASALSRRNFLLSGGAAVAAAPVILAAGSSPAAAQASEASAPAGKVSSKLVAKVNETIDADKDRLVAIFKDIHQNPELGFMEVRTSGIVAEQLSDLGFEVVTGIGKTGVVAVMRNGKGPVVMFRADMDANAVQEETGVDYASKVRVKRDDGLEVPVAHMCGHDAHVTWMLGMARVMTNMRDQWSGTLVLVGQPAEEPIAGAKAMVDDGLYKVAPKPDYFLALHTAPVPTGMVGMRGGMMQAGTDQIDVTFRGVGGHGSTPQLTRDPVVMGAYAITEYQALVSRAIPPLETAVVTVGSFQAGTDNNVIPDTSLLKVNLRFFSEETRQKLIKGIRAINEGIARTYGMPEDQLPTMVMKGNSPPLANDEALIERMVTPLRTLIGEDKLLLGIPPVTGSEDAHVLVAPHPDTKIAYLYVGVADERAMAAATKKGEMLAFAAHGPHYRVDPASIPAGAKVATVCVLELLAK